MQVNNEQWSIAQFRNHAKQVATEKPVKKSKYLNVKTTVDDIVFDSKKESQRYLVLKRMQSIGEISKLVCQKTFPLLCDALVINGSVVKLDKPMMRSYIADFVYTDKKGNEIVEDVKSDMTRKLKEYKLKKKLMKLVYGITIFES